MEQDLSAIGFQAVLDALVEAGLVGAKAGSGWIRLRCWPGQPHEPAGLCARELAIGVKGDWPKSCRRPNSRNGGRACGNDYVDSQTDYRASVETLARKMVEAGQDAQQVLGWLAGAPEANWAQANKPSCWRRVFAEQFEVVAVRAAGSTQDQGAVGF